MTQTNDSVKAWVWMSTATYIELDDWMHLISCPADVHSDQN